jgi:hypothetical protein
MSKSYNAYGHAGCKDAVWEKASKMRGYNPDTHRKDAAGNIVYYNHYGKDTKMGWNIDHIKAVANGGSGALKNLQVLQSSYNKSCGASTKKANRHK